MQSGKSHFYFHVWPESMKGRDPGHWSTENLFELQIQLKYAI